MTNNVCASFCAGYAWFATEYSQECYCGNSLDTGSKPATDNGCNMRCAGDSKSICGGPNGFSLYTSISVKAAAGPAVLPSVSDYQSWGCYRDNDDGRALTTVYNDGQMIIELCAARAKSGGYSFFGFEYGSECWMGGSLKAKAKSLIQEQCSFLCPGNALEYCGKGNALQMYSSTGPAPNSAKARMAIRGGGHWLFRRDG